MTMQTRKLNVTAEWIQAYAESIGSPLQRVGQKLVAPSTMPILFWQSFDVTLFQNNEPILHGSQQFAYKRPIIEGMTLQCELQLTNQEEKTGKQGPLTLHTYTLIVRENEEEILQATTILIKVGAFN